ncbi:MAG: InlB B-repeat-containing protein [Clostridiales Family XIII bacterium]|jgi:uncharacterized repeat protein (TIGR02543 family)|nr:InlB B-repeat-containing protein [Clostridiales Family XIII bacterium]
MNKSTSVNIRRSALAFFVSIIMIVTMVFAAIPANAHSGGGGGGEPSEGDATANVTAQENQSSNFDTEVSAAKQVTVTFKANGGKIYKNYKYYSSTTKKVNKNKKIGSMPKPTKSSYVLVGWYTAKSGGTKYTTSTKVKANKTLYAHWAKEYPTITFDPNGGTVSQTTKQVKYKDEYGSLPVPVRFDHEFLGWYTAKTGGSKIGGSTKVTITKDQKLYAHWKVNPTTYLADMTQYAWYGKESAWSNVVKPGNAVADNHGAIHSYGAVGKAFSYSDGASYFLPPKVNSVTYDINKQYKTFKASWGLMSNNVQENKKLWIKVYGDDKLLLTTTGSENGAALEPININVQGVKYLKFELCSDYLGSDAIYHWELYAIFDPILYR